MWKVVEILSTEEIMMFFYLEIRVVLKRMEKMQATVIESSFVVAMFIPQVLSIQFHHLCILG